MVKRWVIVFLLIVLSLPSFAQENQPVIEQKADELNIKKKDASKTDDKGIVKLDEVVVTATRTEKSIESVPGKVNVVSRKDIERRNLSTVDTALKTVPGIFNRRYGLADTLAAVSLGGIPEQKRTLVLMDGIVLNNGTDAGVDYTVVAMENVEKIEVVQGPFSSLYGGYAMGGVVNIVSRMPEKREFTFKTGYGSSWHRGEAMDDMQKHFISYGDKFRGKLSVLASYGYESTNGYSKTFNVQSSAPPAGSTGWETTTTNQGALRYIIGDKGDNTWWDDRIGLKARYDFSPQTHIALAFMRTRYKYNYEEPHTYLKDAAGNPFYTYGSVRENTYLSGSGGTEINMYSLKGETEIGMVKTKLSFGFNDAVKNWYTTPNSSSPYATLSGLNGKLSSTPNQNYNIDLQFTVPVMNRNILTFGGSYKYDTANTEEHSLTWWSDETSKTALTYNAGGKAKSYAIFVQDEILILPNLTAYVGFREDWWNTTDGYANQFGSGAFAQTFDSRSASSFSPKLAVVYKPFDKTGMRLSAGQAFRAPTVYELYRTWVSSTGVTYNGNPDLKPETVRSWDFGISQGLWKGGKISAGYFENYLEDLIYRKSVSTTQQDYINAGKAETRGVTLELEQRFEKYVRLFGGYTYTDARIKENSAKPDTVNKRLTQMPDQMAHAGIEVEVGPFSAAVTGRYVGKRYGDDLNRDTVDGVYTSYDPFYTADVKASYKILKYAKVSLSIDNIAGETHFEYYKTPGRSWFAQLEFNY